MQSVDAAALVLRAVVGAIFLVQGYRKTFAPPGARGSGAALRDLIASAGFPAPALLARVVAVVELVGGALLLLGLATRVATIPLALTLVVAIVRFKWRDGFQGGWDWPLSVLAGTVALFLLGAGAFSIDHLLGL